MARLTGTLFPSLGLNYPCVNWYSLLALAQGAGLYKLVRPQMTEDNVILVKGGR